MKKRKNQVQENNCNVQFNIFTPTTYRHGWVEDQLDVMVNDLVPSENTEHLNFNL